MLIRPAAFSSCLNTLKAKRPPVDSALVSVFVQAAVKVSAAPAQQVKLT